MITISNNTQDSFIGKGRNVLIIDDDENFAKSIGNMLTMEGYSVSIAIDTKAAEKALDNYPIDLALIDVCLGNDSGIDLIPKFKRANPDLACVLITAYASAETAIQALHNGAYDYLCKPIESDVLLVAIERCYERMKVALDKRDAENTLQLIQFAIDKSADLAFWMTSGAQFFYVNETACNRLGYSNKELSEMNFYDIDLNITKDAWFKYWRDLKKEGNYIFETIFKEKYGSTFPVDVSFNFINRGGEEYICAFARDITERREKEVQLLQSQKMEAIGQLTGGIAHDFNNLLSIISGNLRFLQQDIGEVNTEIEELFEDALSAVDDGTELTQRLLAFSRSRTLNPEIKNVNETIEKFIRFLSRTLGENIALDIELTDEDLFISVDPSQLENALLNLSINARDAMPEGGTITISAERYHHGEGEGEGEGLIFPEGDYIKITVTDTGSGISSEDLPYVYEPFFTTKEVGQGSGLGLSMVYGFTQQSNGSCHISSVSGKGTTVSLYFPEVMDNKNIDKKPEDDEDITMRGSEVILVVEDEPRVRRVTLRDLKNLGYKTLEAGNADMAKTMIESGEPIDLLFSDILMPGKMNGHKLATWTEKNFPEIKIILTSGYSKGKAAVRRDEAHPFPLLRKPYSIDKLAKQIRATLTE